MNPQHTGEYPYSVYPPLNYKWTYKLVHNDFLMISASISSNGVIYVGDGGRFLRAIDIESGKILWKKGLTANVWTTSLINDTLLLAGTSISFDTTMATLFLLNAKRGDSIWGIPLFTVEFQPVPVDTFIYVSNLQGVMYGIKNRGKIIWRDTIYAEAWPYAGGGAIIDDYLFAGADESPFLSLNRYTGEEICKFDPSGWIDNRFPLVKYPTNIYFFASETLYCVNKNLTEILWRKNEFGKFILPTPSLYDTWLLCTRFGTIYKLHADTGDEIWKIHPVDSGGTTSITITENKIFWAAGDNLYSIDLQNGDTLFRTKYTDKYIPWLNSWFWPIFYGPYVIAAHYKKMYIYKGTEFNMSQNDEFFIFYPSLIRSEGYLFLNLLSSSYVKLEVLDVSGRLREIINLGRLEKGKHFYVFKPKNLSNGIYFIKWKGERKKFIFLKIGS